MSTIASVLTPMIHYPTDTPVIVEVDEKALVKLTGYKILRDEDGQRVFILQGETIGELDESIPD